MPQRELTEVVDDAFGEAVLFVYLQDAPVFEVGCGKDARRFARQKDAGVGAVAVDEATNDDHGKAGTLHATGENARRGRPVLRQGKH